MRKADPLQRKRDILLLARRIGELPRAQKLVLAMYYYENLKPTEIAACLGLTEREIELIRAQTVRLLQANLFRESRRTKTA
jgi:DNA-directed RNA polymerase specialized sigma subunit